jgi:redox-sensitive bicupin YhaK (pirin superfamily)
MVVLVPGSRTALHAEHRARIVMIGGEPLGHRFMVWNFVSSRRQRIVQAQEDWQAQRFAKVPGETEFIPLPAARG